MARSQISAQGWHGWDAYAPFYDWENRRTVGRRDIRFWTDLARRVNGTVLELGCGTGRLSLPVTRVAKHFVGIDRSEPMLGRLRTRLRRARLMSRTSIIRGDIRSLPFRKRWRCELVMAPYGMLQSLLSDADFDAVIGSAARVLARGGILGIDLVPDLSRWQEYKRHKSLEGPFGQSRHVTLVESVRQDRRRRLTFFDQEFIEREGRKRKVHQCSITFRTLTVPEVTRRLERVGFRVDAVLGDYQGDDWSPDADVWVIIAKRGK